MLARHPCHRPKCEELGRILFACFVHRRQPGEPPRRACSDEYIGCLLEQHKALAAPRRELPNAK